MGRLFRRRGFSFWYWSAAVWFLSCSRHMVAATGVRRVCWRCSPSPCVCSPGPDPGQVLTSLWTAQCGPRAAQLVGGSPPLALSCAHRQHHPAKPRRAVSGLPGTGATWGTSFPSRGLTLYLQQGLNPSLTQGPLFQVCAFLRYCLQALENSLGSLPCYNV